MNSSSDLMMKVVTFLCILFTEMISGEYRAICPTQPIEAEEGDDVTLQCRLDPQLNLVHHIADWKRVDLNDFVHVYRNQKDDPDPQMKRYRHRTTLNHEDLSRGILTLQISSVQLSDTGPYKCYFPKWRAGCTVNLTVGTKKDACSTTTPPLEEVAKLDVCDGENRRAVPAGVIPAVVLILCVLVVVLVLKGRVIQDCMKRFRGRGAAERDEDQERPAEISTGNII